MSVYGSRNGRCVFRNERQVIFTNDTRIFTDFFTELKLVLDITILYFSVISTLFQFKGESPISKTIQYQPITDISSPMPTPNQDT